ncbi:MAG: high frequency lysogenization protein HflD [Proteobacteria bacterium]|nr:high frequency lysogenization protein HflD [Pseudomonadota bacterium]
MREERVIALAGLLQAVSLVRTIALRGGADDFAMRPSLVSIFKIDADSPADVYGGLANLRPGLESLIAQLDDGKRDLSVTRIVIAVMRIERKLSSRPAMLEKLRAGIEAIAPRVSIDEATGSLVIARLAELYVQTISTLQPRIVVEGNPQFLQQETQIARIRALLLAAIRAAVLWRQVGGTRWRLIFRQRQYSMLARGLLAQCTLGGA